MNISFPNNDNIKKNNKIKPSSIIKNVLISGLLSLEIATIMCIISTFHFRYIIPTLFCAVAVILLFFVFLFSARLIKVWTAISILLPTAVLAGLIVINLCVYRPFLKMSPYENIPCNSEHFFSDKKVMVIVPHEDDDLNLVSGVIDNYISAGSEVYSVFVTNGDYYGLGQERINEAIKCWEYLGIAESNVYFLGYGDKWDDNGLHIYNSAPDEPRVSHIGYSKTYGTKTHPAYHDGVLYTNSNYKNDVKDLILEIRPDTLFVIDYDKHGDHKAVSMVTEQVLGEILKESDDYKPIVYKGYGYSTAWTADNDYYSINIRSTQKPKEAEYEPIIYDWQNRIRMPVSTSSLSRSIFSSSVFKALSLYETQNADRQAVRVINGDKVFWQRRTDSVLYKAKITVSSGESSHLTDFKILDNNDVKDQEHYPYDGVWTPNEEDKNQSIQVVLKEPTDISQIVFYDHPSLSDNITNIRITFNDNTVIETGKLNENGTATVININKSDVTSFCTEILSSEGNSFGIAEIEAFSTNKQDYGSFIKLIDSSEDFIYDYCIDNHNTALSLYSNSEEMPILT